MLGLFVMKQEGNDITRQWFWIKTTRWQEEEEEVKEAAVEEEEVAAEVNKYCCWQQKTTINKTRTEKCGKKNEQNNWSKTNVQREREKEREDEKDDTSGDN
jgi:hypothetical protein